MAWSKAQVEAMLGTSGGPVVALEGLEDLREGLEDSIGDWLPPLKEEVKKPALESFSW
jgi:hypothetical protein